MLSDEQGKRCFVVGPIGAKGSEIRIHADNLFHEVIVPALTPLAFEEKNIIRADHLENPGSINEQVINLILECELVVADLSFHNPNAFYELGIADAAEKSVISFCREADNIPFDRMQDRTIRADIAIWQEKVAARQMVTQFATKALAPDFKVSNPVTHARGFAALQNSADPKDKIISDLQLRMEALEGRSRLYESSILLDPGSLLLDASKHGKHVAEKVPSLFERVTESFARQRGLGDVAVSLATQRHVLQINQVLGIDESSFLAPNTLQDSLREKSVKELEQILSELEVLSFENEEVEKSVDEYRRHVRRSVRIAIGGKS